MKSTTKNKQSNKRISGRSLFGARHMYLLVSLQKIWKKNGDWGMERKERKMERRSDHNSLRGTASLLGVHGGEAGSCSWIRNLAFGSDRRWSQTLAAERTESVDRPASYPIPALVVRRVGICFQEWFLWRWGVMRGVGLLVFYLFWGEMIPKDFFTWEKKFLNPVRGGKIKIIIPVHSTIGTYD